ncbi:hypothetical protein Tco_0513373 [Tanacetum coccineum]
MVAALKVPMLKPENGNAPPITKVVEGVETINAPTTAEEKAQRRSMNQKIKKDQSKLQTKAHKTWLFGGPLQLLAALMEQFDTAHGVIAIASTQATALTHNNENLSDAVLESVEARLLVYKKNKSVYEEDIKVLKKEFVIPVVDNSEAKASKAKPKAIRKNNGSPIIED